MLHRGKKWRRSKRQPQAQESLQGQEPAQQSAHAKAEDFSTFLFAGVDENIENIKTLLGSPSDLITRKFTLNNSNWACAIVYLDGLTDKDLIHLKLMKNIQLEMGMAHKQLPHDADEMVRYLENQVLSVSEMKKAETLDEVMLSVLSGDTALFVDGARQVLLLGSRGGAVRSVEEPVSEALVRGPRDGFTENIRTNTSLVRRRIRDANLRYEPFKIGRRSKTDVVVAYVEGIVHPELVQEVRRRLESIDVDQIPETGFIEQYIQDSTFSPFPQIAHTERPDRASSALLQGRVVIFVDGTPFVLTMPTTLGGLLQSPEDYYERWALGTLLRVLRYLSSFVALFLPALYISLIEYHQGMIPSKLAFSAAAAREGVPFPAVVEAFLMEFTMELLREAGVRLPKPIGQTVGIVGGLVIGEAAVTAGIVSPVMVIVVSITAMASFSLPSYSFAISLRILRFGFMLAAATFGFFGVIMAYIMVNIHLVNLKSFGVPYSTPFAPTFGKDMDDLVLRAPLTMMEERPVMLNSEDPKRMKKEGDGP